MATYIESKAAPIVYNTPVYISFCLNYKDHFSFQVHRDIPIRTHPAPAWVGEGTIWP